MFKHLKPPSAPGGVGPNRGRVPSPHLSEWLFQDQGKDVVPENGKLIVVFTSLQRTEQLRSRLSASRAKGLGPISASRKKEIFLKGSLGQVKVRVPMFLGLIK